MTKIIKSIFAKHRIFLILLILFNVLLYFYFFAKNTVILNGEGNYWLDFNIYLQNSGYTWLNLSTGVIATTINSIFSFPFLFSFINNINIQSFLIVTLTYCLPFSFAYLLFISIDAKRRNDAVLSSLFFVFNPFSVFFLNGLNPWVTHALFIHPLYFLIILKYYNNNLKLFFYFGITSLFFAYALVNPPLMVLALLSLPFWIAIAQLLLNNRNEFKAFITKVVLTYLSVFLFNLWWIAQWVIVLPDVRKSYTIAIAKSWLANVSTNTSYIFTDIFSFLWITPKAPEYNFLSFFYSLPFIKISLYIPFLILLYWLVTKRSFAKSHKIVYVLLGFLLCIVPFLKGNNLPFSNMLLSCFEYIPFCIVFKTAPEKFGVLFVFVFSLILFFIIRDIKKRAVIFALYSYIILLSIPFISGKFIPDNKIFANRFTTAKFVDTREFKDFRSNLTAKKLDFRIMSLPSYLNYDVMIHLHDNRYYLGVDPLLLNTPHSFVADYNFVIAQIPQLFLMISSPYHEKLQSIYSVRYVHLNKRFYPLFGSLSDMSVHDLEKVLDKKFKSVHKFGGMNLYTNSDFLPHFFTPRKIIYQSHNPESFPDFILSPSYDIRSVIISGKENRKRTLYSSRNLPILEFKKINATKYKLIAHNVSDSFPLVFNETFHHYWKLYLTKVQSKATNQEDLKKQLDTYLILKGNEEDQASKEEVEKFIDNNWISILGKTKTTDFISKNFNGSIQNDNIENGEFYETWLTGTVNKNFRQISENSHILVNSYANAWMVDPRRECENADFCKKNKDGTYNMEFVVEFLPQQVFYATVTISSVALIIILSCAIWRKRRQKNAS